MKDFICVIYDWLAISDKVEKADAIFLFGGPHLSTPKKGLDLFMQGFAPKILAAGDTGTFDDSGWGRPNADVFAEYLFDEGVPKDAVLIENTSMNTLEDVLNSLFFLEEKQIHFSKIILVSRPFHQRRSYATFKKQSPETVLINCPSDEIHPSVISDIKTLKDIGTRCVQEYERLGVYAQRGDLVKQEVSSSVEEAYRELTGLLNTEHIRS